ncbi:outer membrane beta-barrel family protein [Myroides odoratus]|nr:outer membrane beta-barrel family protein [Myroides odoratus]
MAQDYAISGKIIDSTMRPKEYLYLNLLNSDASFYTAAVTDSLGQFNIQAPENLYIITIEQYGKTLLYRNVELRHNLNLGEIIIEEDNTQLDEINISIKKKIIERKVDRIVFNVEHSITSSSGDGMDILRQSPSIRVSDEKISIIGKNEIKIMVNNRLIPLSGNDLINYLKSIRAEDIAKVEIITTPPANFEAEGNSGLVNIILKSIPSDTGFNGRIHSSFTQSKYPSGTLGVSLNHTNKKIQILSALTIGDGITGPTLRNSFYYPDETWKTQSNRKDYYKYLSGRFGLDYKMSTNTNIGFQYLINLSEWDIDANETTFIQNKIKNSQLKTISNSDSKANSHSFNANFKHNFDSLGKELIIDLDYLNYKNDWNRNFTTLQENSSTGQNDISDLSIAVYSGKVHLSFPFSFGTLETGGKVSFATNDSYTILYPNTNNTSLSFERNDFVFKENIQAIYTNFNKSIGERIELKVGLRIENTHTSFLTKETNNTNKNNYIKLFPTLYLTYKLNENHNQVLALNYSRRIGRPNYIQLNPFRWYSNPFVYTEGNPSLQPSFTDNIELSHTFGNLISSFYFSRIKAGFGQVTITPTDTQIQHTRSENYYNSTQVGLSESFSFNPFSFWQSYNQGFVYYSKSKATIQGINPEQNGFGAYLSTDNTFSLNAQKTIALALNYWYQLPESYGLASTNGYGQFDIGFSMKVLKEQLTITGNVTDIFGTNRPKSTSYSNNIKQIYNNYFDSQYFRIGVSYNFGKNKIKDLSRETSNTEERSRTTI